MRRQLGSEQLLCDVEQLLVAPQAAYLPRQHALLVQQHGQGGELLFQQRQAMEEVGVSAERPQLPRLPQRVGHLVHLLLHRGHGRPELLLAQHVSHQHVAPFIELLQL
jgi:hypothetical protein